jgi:hypothetical protein
MNKEVESSAIEGKGRISGWGRLDGQESTKRKARSGEGNKKHGLFTKSIYLNKRA